MPTSSIFPMMLMLGCTFVVQGCAQLPTVKNDVVEPAGISALHQSALVSRDAIRLIAADLVSVLIQLANLDKRQIHLHTGASPDEFDLHVEAALEIAGYHWPLRDDIAEEQVVVTSVTHEHDGHSRPQAGRVSTYELKLDDIVVRRGYAVESGRITPVTRMHVDGVNTVRVRLNDSAFLQMKTEEPVKSSSGFEDVAATNLSVQAVGPHATAKSGSRVRISVTTSRNVELHCYFQRGIDSVARVFPNRFAKSAVVAAGQSLAIPASDAWQLGSLSAHIEHHLMCIELEPDTVKSRPIEPLLPDLLFIEALDVDQVLAAYEKYLGVAPIYQIVPMTVD